MMNVAGSVILDYTLHDLYTADKKDKDVWIVYAYAPPPTVEISSSIPTLTRFPVQSPLCPAIDKEVLAQNLFHVTAQRFGFCSGPMRIVVFELGQGNGHGTSVPCHHMDVSRVFGQLKPEQRPVPTYIRHPKDLLIGPQAQLAVTVPLDWLTHCPHLIDPSAHYNLLSKRGLAESGLPTPKTMVIDTILSPSRSFTAVELQEEIVRMTEPIRENKLPFILKVPRVASIGQGTFIVHTEADRSAVYTTFLREVKSMLLALSPSNESLRPCNLIIQELISGETVGLTFFVTKAGRAIFNCCTRQEVDDAYCWSGGFVSYHEQPALERHYRATMDKVAQFLHKNKYFGPAGVDVMTDQAGTQLVVDLNVRTTGTYHLGPLRGHFTRRGLFDAAALANQRLKCTQAEFETHFTTELASGCLLVTAWVHARDACLATITAAEKNRASLQGLIQKVAGFAELCAEREN